jgi:hypothetical protein
MARLPSGNRKPLNSDSATTAVIATPTAPQQVALTCHISGLLIKSMTQGKGFKTDTGILIPFALWKVTVSLDGTEAPNKEGQVNLGNKTVAKHEMFAVFDVEGEVIESNETTIVIKGDISSSDKSIVVKDCTYTYNRNTLFHQYEF